MLEKTLESLLDSKEIKTVNTTGNEPWLFIAKTDVETEDSIIWPPDAKSQLTGKDRDAGKDWGQEKWATEDEMVGWHHWLNGHEFEQTQGVSEEQGSLMCCSPWGYKALDTTEQLNNKNYIWAQTCPFYLMLTNSTLDTFSICTMRTRLGFHENVNSVVTQGPMLVWNLGFNDLWLWSWYLWSFYVWMCLVSEVLKEMRHSLGTQSLTQAMFHFPPPYFPEIWDDFSSTSSLLNFCFYGCCYMTAATLYLGWQLWGGPWSTTFLFS